MAVTTIGDKTLVFGAKDRLPLKGWPEGKVRIIVRNEDFVRGYVRSPDGKSIRQFIVGEEDGCWIPRFEQGSNIRGESDGVDWSRRPEPPRRHIDLTRD